MFTRKYNYWLFIAPTLILLAVIIVIPFIIGIFYSFTNSNGLTASWIGLKNYQLLLSDDNFLESCWLTILFSLLSVVGINVIGLGFALLVTRSDNYFNRLLRTIFFVPNLIGGILLGFIWQFIFIQIFQAFGESLDWSWLKGWLSTPATGLWGLVILFWWQMSGYIMLIYISFLNNIPKNTIESAELDGANNQQIFWHIKLPQLAPAFTISLFLTLANSFKIYEQNLALTNGGPYRSTELISMNIYNTAFVNYQQGYAQAEGIVLFIFVMLVSFAQLYFSRKRES
ncbi:carbohydrate ABC transporter permease [Oenococcus oeni]|uniref:Carbohydrate ABC transporter membrane protein 1, CUT1 family n=15 Tax=Oenococcus oeni TaxID=1247 RepID=Q04HP6_OENOB|nr:sugar ABC transporter permease [Oenococcus oeni]EAV39068.1 multiple sugar ABC transporter permease protein [Oenococcus oeni ATCC BAA-1163]KGO16825.1 ABC transporter permease [Oenococcus oeni X2L]ABJ56026.1 carbohydrate ABC transporter membrane protein 1, CUT1 family [Oenococcus oeni PSU-1]AVI93366.1 ABC transporter permease [Oenococcus oeni]AWW98758.1 sugar ABC transporter permease [Oenococcus oeni]